MLTMIHIWASGKVSTDVYFDRDSIAKLSHNLRVIYTKGKNLFYCYHVNANDQGSTGKCLLKTW